MHAISWALVVLLIAASGAAKAASLVVAPLEISLPASGRAAEMHVTNNDPSPVLVQVKVLPWVEPEEVDFTATSQNVIAVPPIAEIAGGSRQLIRLALRQPLQGPREQAYRLVISEVRKELPSELTGVTMSIRLNLPMYATPKGAAPNTRWTVEPTAAGPELVLANIGTARLSVRELSLHDGRGSAVGVWDDAPETALAGESVSWPLGKSLRELPATLEVRAETNRGPLVATVTRPGG